MKFTRKPAMLAAAVVLIGAGLMLPATTQAQIIGSDIGENAQASWNTASSATMALRAPGSLVSSARADFRERHASTIIRSRFGPVIDEPAPDGPTLEQQVRIDTINAVFDNLNAGLLVLLNAVRASGGLSPVGPGGTNLSDLLGHINGPG